MMKIFSNKNKKQKNIDVSQYPKVIYENKRMKDNISKWLKFLGCSSFGIVLRDIGFKPEDTVYLYDIECSDKLNFNYSLNDGIRDFSKRIYFRYGNFLELPPCVIVSDNKNEIIYQCVRTNPEVDGIWFDISSYQKELSPNLSYCRNYSQWGAYFGVVNKNNKLSFSLSNFDKPVIDGVHILNNEEELEKYLTGLVFPIQIDEVYKKICEITSANPSEYNVFCLEVSKLEKSETKTDIIDLRRGNLEKFGMTINNKTILLDNNGNCLYKILGNETVPVDFSINSSDENVSCSFSINDGYTLEDYTDTFFQYDINTAREEIANVKKRVRVMLNKNITNRDS